MSKGKILFIAPKFAGYENEIIEAIKNNCYSIDYFPEKLYGKYSLLIKKISISFYHKLQADYLKTILAYTKDKEYDFLFVIRGEILDLDFLNTLNAQTTIKHKINYQWDSVERNLMLNETKSFYDNIYSFDRKDCKEFGFNYKPLFYIEKYINKQVDKKNDLLFIGTEHGERIKYINQYKQYCIENKLKFRIVLYMSFLNFVKNKLFNNEFKSISLSDVIFKKISIKDSYELIARSSVVLDVANLKQTGLTMRTIETLGGTKKLITNNLYIKEDIFFDKDVVQFIDEKISSKYFTNPIDRKVNIKNLEINEWVNDFFKNI